MIILWAIEALDLIVKYWVGVVLGTFTLWLIFAIKIGENDD
jgi:hypothetical protein